MTVFQQDLIKIVLDKLLLGAIILLLSYWIAKRLEDYKNKKAHELSKFRDKATAIFRLLGVITEHHYKVLKLLDLINLVKEKYPEKITEEEAKPGYKYIDHYEVFTTQVGQLAPLTDYDVMESLNNYRHETLKVTNIIKGDFSLGYPDQEKLNEAVSKFLLECRKSLDRL